MHLGKEKPWNEEHFFKQWSSKKRFRYSLALGGKNFIEKVETEREQEEN